MAEGARATRFGLLGLPAEIRKEIHRHLLVLPVISIVPRKYLAKTGCILPYHKPCFDEFTTHNDFSIDFYEDRMLLRPRQVLHTAVLRINKQIYHEAVVIMYAENVFKLVALWHYCEFFESLNTEYANLVTRVALEADGPLGYDIFAPFYQWYGRMDLAEEVLEPSTDVRMQSLVDKLRTVHLPALKRLEIRFQYGSTLMNFHQGSAYQGPARSLLARNCEPWFQRNLANLDRLCKTCGEGAADQDESRQAPPPLILEVEHSEASSKEVVPGLRNAPDIYPGFRFDREDPSLDRVQTICIKCCHVSLRTSNAPPRHFGGAQAVKQRLFCLNQAMLRLRNERVKQRPD
jgi:hypothetical protein